jgi:hypothetical protein
MKNLSLITTKILLFGCFLALAGCRTPSTIEPTETLSPTQLTEDIPTTEEDTPTTEHAAASPLPSTFEEAKALITNPFAPFLKVLNTTGSSQSSIDTEILYQSDNGKISLATTLATQQDLTEKKF